MLGRSISPSNDTEDMTSTTYDGMGPCRRCATHHRKKGPPRILQHSMHLRSFMRKGQKLRVVRGACYAGQAW